MVRFILFFFQSSSLNFVQPIPFSNLLKKTRAVLGFRGRYLGRSLYNTIFHFYCQYFVLVCLLFCSNKVVGVVRFASLQTYLTGTFSQWTFVTWVPLQHKTWLSSSKHKPCWAIPFSIMVKPKALLSKNSNALYLLF